MPRPDAAGDPSLEAQEGERPPQRLPVDVQGAAELPLAGKPASARRVGFLEKAEEPLLRPLERRDLLNGPSASRLPLSRSRYRMFRSVSLSKTWMRFQCTWNSASSPTVFSVSGTTRATTCRPKSVE